MQLDQRSSPKPSGQPLSWSEEDDIQFERPLWQKKRFWFVAGITSLLGIAIDSGYSAVNLAYRYYQRKTAGEVATENPVLQQQYAGNYPIIPAATAAALGSLTPHIANIYFPTVLHLADEALRRLIMVQAVIESKDDAWRWVIEWLAEQPDVSDRSVVTVTTSFRHYGHHRPSNSANQDDAETLPRPLYAPGQGTHIVNFHGKRIFIERRIKGAQPNASVIDERLQLSVFGFSQRPIRQLISEARQLALERDKSRTVVFVGDAHGNWQRNASRPRRPLGSVVLEEGLAERLLSDAQEFLSSERAYLDRGIPYRRGYLLHGPPGTGKTSFITALAGQLGYNIYVLNLGSHSMTNELLVELMSSTPKRAILLLEDIDSAMSESGQVTFSGLLNAIDGIVAQEGRLLFMTTNFIEKLSPQLVRPGRIDIKAYFGLAQKSQIGRLARKFFASEDVVKYFVDNVPDQTLSMASLQGYLIRCRSDPEWAVQNLKAFLTEENNINPATVTHST